MRSEVVQGVSSSGRGHCGEVWGRIWCCVLGRVEPNQTTLGRSEQQNERYRRDVRPRVMSDTVEEL